MDIVVITVTHGAAEAVREWASALQVARERAPAGCRVRVVVVDNASPDETVEWLRRTAPWAEVFPQHANRGYAAGCNVGLGHAGQSELIVLLNPDVKVELDFFVRLAGYQWPSDVAAIGPMVIGQDGEIEQSARRFPGVSTGIFGRTSVASRLMPGNAASRRELRARPDGGSADVDWVSGACLIAPHARFQDVGALDERFFMYWEDADWCKRASDRGYRIRYEPQLRVHHAQGSSSAAHPFRTVVEFHRSAFRYYRRHSQASSVLLVFAGVALAARCAAKLARAGLRAVTRSQG